MVHNSVGCVQDFSGPRHEYGVKTCTQCGADFCYSCCGGTNVDQGGKHDPDYMHCPVCGYDYCSLGDV